MPLRELSEFYSSVQSPDFFKDQKSLVFWVTGDDYFLKKELSDLLKIKLKPENPEFNETYVELDKVDLSQIEMDIKSYPMMSPFRLTVVSIAQGTPEARIRDFFKWLESAELHDSIVLIVSEPIDFKKNYIQSGISKWQVIDCKTPFSYQIPTWIVQLASRYGLKFSNEALALFHERVGDSLASIDLELKKFHGLSDQKIIHEDLVQKVVTLSAEANIFDSVKSFFKKDKVQTHYKISSLISSGESPLGFLSLVARHARLLIKMRSGLSQGYRGPKLAQYLKIPAYFLKNYEGDLKIWTEDGLLNLISSLADLELTIKTKNIDQKELVLNWTIQEF